MWDRGLDVIVVDVKSGTIADRRQLGAGLQTGPVADAVSLKRAAVTAHPIVHLIFLGNWTTDFRSVGFRAFSAVEEGRSEP